MTSYLFISNTTNFKINLNFIIEIRNILKLHGIKSLFTEIKKGDFYEWKFEEIIGEKHFQDQITWLLC